MRKSILYVVVTVMALSAFGAAAQQRTKENVWRLKYENTLTNGLHALKRQEFEKAFNLLSESAKWGDKQAQFFLAQMYFNGWYVEQDYQIGWLWINVALEQRDAEWATAYNRIKQALPEEFVTAMEPLVEQHIAEYGAEAKDLNCRKIAATGSNIRETRCEKRFY